MKYRMEYKNTEEYVAILLLGIAEEIREYRGSVYGGESIENQLNEYGDILWNIAELENLLDERCPRHKLFSDSREKCEMDITRSCIQAVRKHYHRDRELEVLLSCAGDILADCHIHFVCSRVAGDAMTANVAKMKGRYS